MNQLKNKVKQLFKTLYTSPEGIRSPVKLLINISVRIMVVIVWLQHTSQPAIS